MKRVKMGNRFVELAALVAAFTTTAAAQDRLSIREIVTDQEISSVDARSSTGFTIFPGGGSTKLLAPDGTVRDIDLTLQVPIYPNEVENRFGIDARGTVYHLHARGETPSSTSPTVVLSEIPADGAAAKELARFSDGFGPFDMNLNNNGSVVALRYQRRQLAQPITVRTISRGVIKDVLLELPAVKGARAQFIKPFITDKNELFLFRSISLRNSNIWSELCTGTVESSSFNCRSLRENKLLRRRKALDVHLDDGKILFSTAGSYIALDPASLDTNVVYRSPMTNFIKRNLSTSEYADGSNVTTVGLNGNGITTTRAIVVMWNRDSGAARFTCDLAKVYPGEKLDYVGADLISKDAVYFTLMLKAKSGGFGSSKLLELKRENSSEISQDVISICDKQ